MSHCNILRPFFLYLLLCYGSKKAVSTETSAGTVNKDHLKVVTLNSDGTLSENDSTKYDFGFKGLLKNQPEYNFKSGSKCVGVKYNDVEVWVYDPSKNQKHPVCVKMDPVAETLWVQFDTFEFYTFHFSDGKWKFNDQVSEGSCKTYNESLSVTDVVETLKSSPTTPEPETSSEADSERSTPSLSEEVDEQNNYVEAKYGEKSFKFELEKEGQLPESVVVNLLGKKYVFVTNRLDELLFKYSEGIQPLKPDQDNNKRILHYTFGSEHYVYKESEDLWIRLTKSDYEKFLEDKEKPGYLLSQLSEAPKYNYIELELTCEESQYYDCYTDSDSNTKTFKTKDEYLFQKITLHGETLWECQDDNMSNLVEFSVTGEFPLLVYLVNGNKILFVRKSVHEDQK